MRTFANQEHLLFGFGFLALIIVTFTWIALLLLIIQERQVAHYPGAWLISDHSIYKIFPLPSTRRDTSYRTGDKFPVVYNWYSNRFNLGSERQAQSSCIHLFETSTGLPFIRSTGVTLCDTPNGRMIFVQRSITLDYR